MVQHVVLPFLAPAVVLCRSPLRAFNDFVKAMRRLCLEGLGLGRVGGFHVEEDIEAGRLVSVLDDYNPGDVEVIWCVYGGSGPLSGRVRAYLDFLSEHVVRASP